MVSFEEFATNKYCECKHCVLEHDSKCKLCDCKKSYTELLKEFEVR